MSRSPGGLTHTYTRNPSPNVQHAHAHVRVHVHVHVHDMYPEFSGYLHGGSGEERPRLARSQCWCPRDVRRRVGGMGVAQLFSVQFSPRVKTVVPLG